MSTRSATPASSETRINGCSRYIAAPDGTCGFASIASSNACKSSGSRGTQSPRQPRNRPPAAEARGALSRPPCSCSGPTRQPLSGRTFLAALRGLPTGRDCCDSNALPFDARRPHRRGDPQRRKDSAISSPLSIRSRASAATWSNSSDTRRRKCDARGLAARPSDARRRGRAGIWLIMRTMKPVTPRCPIRGQLRRTLLFSKWQERSEVRKPKTRALRAASTHHNM